MGDEEKAQPSLELPRLLGGRKRSSRKTAPAPATPETGETEVIEPAAEPVAEPVRKPTRKPVSKPTASAPAASVADGDTRVFEEAAVEPATPATPAAPAAEKTPREPRKPREPKAPKAPRGDRAPLFVGRVAAIVTGLVVGAGLLALTAGGLEGCEAVRGTNSCGTAPGMLALVVIFSLAVIAGRFLLALFKVPDPGSTSFLAVGLTAVVALLFFVDQLDSWPMLIVIPVLSAASYLLSWWVTTTYIEPAG